MKKTNQSKNYAIKSDLFTLFAGIRDGKVKKEDAMAMVKVSNAICNYAKTELLIAKFNKENGVATRGRKKQLSL